MNRYAILSCIFLASSATGYGLGALTDAASSSPDLTVDAPVRTIDLDPITIVAEPTEPTAPTVLEMPPMVVRASAPRPVRPTVQVEPVEPVEVTIVDLDQGGRPGARTVRAWGI